MKNRGIDKFVLLVHSLYKKPHNYFYFLNRWEKCILKRKINFMETQKILPLLLINQLNFSNSYTATTTLRKESV